MNLSVVYDDGLHGRTLVHNEEMKCEDVNISSQ